MDLVTAQKTCKQMKKDSDAWIDVIDGFQIENAEHAELAKEVLSELKEKLDLVEETRTGITKPLLEAKRKVDALFKPVTTSLKSSLDTMRGRLGKYTAQQREEAQRLLAQASQSEPEEAAALVAASNRAKAEAPSVREVWRFEIEDVSKLPSQFLIPDEKAIGAVVRSQKGNAKIPGVKVFVEHRAVIK